MTKLELAEFVSAEVGLSGVTAKKAVEAVIAGLQKGCEVDGKVVLRKFGTFKTITKPARKFKYYIAGGGETVIPERTMLRFIPSTSARQ